MTTGQKKIPLLDLGPEIEQLGDDLLEAVARVLRMGRFILGPEVEAFEQELASFLGAKHAVGVGSGTDALMISLRALDIGPGDEVITTPFTFVATAEAICNLGARPVFVDIDPNTFNIDPQLIEPAITRHTRAIVPVHLFGLAAEMDTIGDIAKRHELRIVEDVAQAFGGAFRKQKLGTLGDAGAFSFFPSKNLGAFGDGGAMVTDDDQVAGTARMLRTHGSRRKYANELLGYNSRLDEIQAALLRVKLPHVEQWNLRRQAAAEHYTRLFEDAANIVTPASDSAHVFHQYTIRVGGDRRDQVQRELADAGIATAVYYPTPVHQLPAYVGFANQPLPRAEAAARIVLSLPIGPSLSEEDIELVAGKVRSACSDDEPQNLSR